MKIIEEGYPCIPSTFLLFWIPPGNRWEMSFDSNKITCVSQSNSVKTKSFMPIISNQPLSGNRSITTTWNNSVWYSQDLKKNFLHVQPVRKIKKLFKVPEQIKFNVRIFQACGIGQSKKYDILNRWRLMAIINSYYLDSM